MIQKLYVLWRCDLSRKRAKYQRMMRKTYRVSEIQVQKDVVHFRNTDTNAMDSVQIENLKNIRYIGHKRGIRDGILFGAGSSAAIGLFALPVVWNIDGEGGIGGPGIAGIMSAAAGIVFIPLGAVVGGIRGSRELYRTENTDFEQSPKRRPAWRKKSD